jgi:uncharacterized protein YbcI
MPSTAGGRACGIAVFAIVADVRTTGRGPALTDAAQSDNLLHEARPHLTPAEPALRLPRETVARFATPGTGYRAASARRTGLASPTGLGVLEVAQRVVSSTPLAGGHLLAAISTSIVGILRDHYGRGPMKAKTYALDDIIVVVMRGSGFTALEQTIMDSGEPDRVIAMREDFQRVMAKQYKETIEALTRRKVLAFLSQAHVEPDITMEIFFVDGPLEGFGAVEITEP